MFFLVYYDHVFTPIYETIQTAGVYKKDTFVPRYFLWKSKKIAVESITYIADYSEGNMLLRSYSILSGGTLYRLVFNRTTEHWMISEIYYEQ